MAASVSTRVVSWKLAALMKESVVRLALVMPSSSGSNTAGSSSGSPFARSSWFLLWIFRLYSSTSCLETCSSSRNGVSPCRFTKAA
mgnify:CR=1 FL=1